MPVFENTILKEKEAYRWVNTYRVQAVDLSQAQAAGDLIIAREKALHFSSVAFIAMKTSLVPNPTRQEFVVRTLTGSGSRSAATANPTGPEIVMFASFEADRGRPGRKFYRYVLDEANIKAYGEGYEWNDTATYQGFFDLVNPIADDLIAFGTPLLIGRTNKPANGNVNVNIATLDTRHGWYNRSPATGTTTGASL